MCSLTNWGARGTLYLIYPRVPGNVCDKGIFDNIVFSSFFILVFFEILFLNPRKVKFELSGVQYSRAFVVHMVTRHGVRVVDRFTEFERVPRVNCTLKTMDRRTVSARNSVPLKKVSLLHDAKPPQYNTAYSLDYPCHSIFSF